ncbi:MAG: GGDEF domain-containing protein [Planctomycetota bacterium]
MSGSPERMVVAGDTALASSMRGRPSVELVRANTAFDALAEVALPLEEAEGSVRVCVHPDLVPSSQRGAFESALRLVSPEASLTWLDGAERDALLEDREPAWRENGRHALEPRSEGRAPSGDAELITTALHGRDVLQRCLDRLRAQGLRVRVASDDPGGTSSPVRLPGVARPVRWLIVENADQARADEAAAWLGAWLELAATVASLRKASLTDPLTGAWNRRYFERFMSRAIEEARASRRSLTLMLFDIDGFKSFNDRHGHGVGDAVLREIVAVLKSCIRPEDRVCRLGGDEFAVVFYEPTGPRERGTTHPSSIYDLAQRFQKAVEGHRFAALEHETDASVTISGGLASFPWDGADLTSLLERADELLLEGKRRGKNVIAVGR